jgi:uncharacterized protein (DUF2384 family)
VTDELMTGIHRDTDVARTAVELFFAIRARLEASESEQATLLCVSTRVVRCYRRGSQLPRARDTLERVSHITTIWLDLTSLFRGEVEASRWLHSPNQKFGGASPFQRMLAGNVSDLVDVRYDVEMGQFSCGS